MNPKLLSELVIIVFVSVAILTFIDRFGRFLLKRNSQSKRISAEFKFDNPNSLKYFVGPKNGKNVAQIDPSTLSDEENTQLLGAFHKINTSELYILQTKAGEDYFYVDTGGSINRFNVIDHSKESKGRVLTINYTVVNRSTSAIDDIFGIFYDWVIAYARLYAGLALILIACVLAN